MDARGYTIAVDQARTKLVSSAEADSASPTLLYRTAASQLDRHFVPPLGLDIEFCNRLFHVWGLHQNFADVPLDAERQTAPWDSPIIGLGLPELEAGQ